MSPVFVSSRVSVFVGALPVAALSTHGCKIDFFSEVLVEHCHLVVLSYCPSVFLMAISGTCVLISDQVVGQSFYIVYIHSRMKVP